jgi:[acyl-carrier-protein] S-malonyltransferase
MPVGLAVVFAGQGAQAVGMAADLHERFAVVRDTFAEAEAACGLPLTRLCFEGPASELDRTEVTQPALLTVDVALWRLCAPLLGGVVAMAGLSLGEYAALVAAGALAFGDAVALVRRRGRYMQEAVPEGEGAMAAIMGLDSAEVEAVCAEAGGPGQVEVANYNCPGQTVVAGRRAAVARALSLARGRGARRAVALPVSAPFHTTLLAPAARRLAVDLEAATFAPPRVPVVANLTAEPIASAAPWPKTLSAQVDHPVRWEASLVKLVDLGAGRIVELGPGRTLAGFARRTVPQVEAVSVGDVTGYEALVERARGGLLT